jgi:hypothetical protein
MTIITTGTGRRIRLRHTEPGPKSLPESANKRRVNVCLSPYWHQTGKERAAARKLSFSEYLEELVYRDSLHNASGE